MKTIITILICFIGCTAFGQQLTYKAKNPAFGGDTFNYTWLLNSANSQNSFTDPNANDADESSLESFADDLNRQLLSQISRTLLNTQLANGLQPGSFNFGDLALEIFESAEGLVINILDTNTGEQSQIIVPN